MDKGDPIPAVTVTTAEGQPLALGEVAGPLVVYFYPKDDTSGCTREAQDFTALAEAFRSAGVRVIGISKDSPAKHQKFAAKYELTVELASDEDGTACEAFGVWGEKKLYGKTYMGIERATFLFDRVGRLATSWRKVKVPGHAEAVLEAARAL
ncbi:peroxiredoxin Q/BCP [Sphingomonas sp. SORGH_AS 950]|uniref:peroxiredoxin n=1 Tax=Sphingomonas sp. SORGH_AS_0950 TaxID=3041792 RepID=UPI0027871EAB|nr:peroxiredoxin [Sphingomonas sp. SORGH_AS_0950]MDQ1158818.1 peroxiredoxin Q/BCP [Sphingomonas sp. SORGH_AS_0950]